MEDYPQIIFDEKVDGPLPDLAELEEEVNILEDNLEKERKLRADKTFKGKIIGMDLKKLKDAKKILMEWEKERADELVLVLEVEVTNAPEVGKILLGTELKNWSFKERPIRFTKTLNPKSNLYKLIKKYLGIEKLKKEIYEKRKEGLPFTLKDLFLFINKNLLNKEVVVVTDSNGFGHIKFD